MARISHCLTTGGEIVVSHVVAVTDSIPLQLFDCHTRGSGTQVGIYMKSSLASAFIGIHLALAHNPVRLTPLIPDKNTTWCGAIESTSRNRSVLIILSVLPGGPGAKTCPQTEGKFRDSERQKNRNLLNVLYLLHIKAVQQDL